MNHFERQFDARAGKKQLRCLTFASKGLSCARKGIRNRGYGWHELNRVVRRNEQSRQIVDLSEGDRPLELLAKPNPSPLCSLVVVPST